MYFWKIDHLPQWTTRILNGWLIGSFAIYIYIYIYIYNASIRQPQQTDHWVVLRRWSCCQGPTVCVNARVCRSGGQTHLSIFLTKHLDSCACSRNYFSYDPEYVTKSRIKALSALPEIIRTLSGSGFRSVSQLLYVRFAPIPRAVPTRDCFASLYTNFRVVYFV